MDLLIARFTDELHTGQAKETPPDPPFARGGVRGSPRPRTASPPCKGGVGGGRRTGSRMYATLALSAALLGTALGATPEDPLPRQRQPTALCLSPDGARLFVANGRSGSLSVVDLKSARVVAERDVGRALADVAALPDGHRLLAVDQAGDALLLLEELDGSVRIIERLAVASDPISLVVTPGGGSCVVASRGSRRLTFVRVSTCGRLPATAAGGKPHASTSPSVPGIWFWSGRGRG